MCHDHRIAPAGRSNRFASCSLRPGSVRSAANRFAISGPARRPATHGGEEKPQFDDETYASDAWPGVLLRSQYAPNLDRIAVTPLFG